jgi:hypothetical protein
MKKIYRRSRDPNTLLCTEQSVKYELLKTSQGKVKLIMDRYESKDGFIVLLRSRSQTAKHKMKTSSSVVKVHCRSKNTLRRIVHSTVAVKMLPTGL